MGRFAPERFGVQLTYRVLAHRALEQSAGTSTVCTTVPSSRNIPLPDGPDLRVFGIGTK